MDFTQREYARLCEAIAASGYRTATFADFIARDRLDLHDRVLVLRHDVDRRPRRARELAEIERRFGLLASYYFRMPASWEPRIIREVAAMGHEVGLHYECLDRARGDHDAAGRLLAEQLAQFRELAPVRTVSMHGNPATRFDNRDMWQHCRLGDFGLTGEVYLSADFERAMYYSDTGRTWLDGRFNVKDVIPAGKAAVTDKPPLKTTGDLIRLIGRDSRNLYLLIHPERWPAGAFGWARSFAADWTLNLAKVAYKLLRRVRA